MADESTEEKIVTHDIYMYEVAVVPEGETPDLSGFSVEATDGQIGTVDEHTYDVGASYLVVDTGPWIFGKKVMLPAGVIRQVDLDDEVIYVARTKDEIKNSPEFDESNYRDEKYRGDLGSYYASKEF
jgi:hypothetical protein